MQKMQIRRGHKENARKDRRENVPLFLNLHFILCEPQRSLRFKF